MNSITTDTVTTTPTSRTVPLFGWEEDFNLAANAVRAALFAIMLELCEGKLKHYRGDLYHDVHWLDEHITGPTTFPFMVRESGTEIGNRVATALLVKAPGTIYDITLYVQRGRWMARIEERTQ